MKFSTILCCALIAAGGAGPALAAPFGQGPGMAPGAQDPRPGPERGADRPGPRRDELRRDENADRGRMDSEERRQLRRDIQDAGRDIYRPGQQGRGDGRRPGRR